TELGAQNAVAGGGRYDGLIKLLGGPPDPGIGFAVGVERVVQLLPDVAQGAWQDRRPGVFLIPLGDEALRRLLPVAGELRAKGIVVEVGHGERKLTRELERASKLEEAKRLGVLHAVILGPDELARGEAKVKDMKSGAQRAVPLSGLVDEVVARAPEAVNPKLPTGEIELAVEGLEVLSIAEPLPIQVSGDAEYPEDARLRHRFLDLRREKLHRTILLRSHVIASIRRRMLGA